MITPDTFRVDLPEFVSTATYPNSAIAYWINLGTLLLNVERWGPGSAAAVSPPSTVYDNGLEMFVAHNLALEKMAQDAANRGGTPGLSTGPQASKSVGPVSASYDTNAGIVKDAGHWNLTTYGTRFLSLVNVFGAGPVQVGGCWPSVNGFGGAWGGVIPPWQG